MLFRLGDNSKSGGGISLLLFLSSGLAAADCISFIAFQIFSSCCCVSANSDFTLDHFRLAVFFSDGGPDEPKSSQS